MSSRSWLTALATAATAIAATIAPAAALPAAAAEPSATQARARFLGQATLPHKLQFEGTTVGGLSGVDRDPWTGEYVLISDDRSNTNPARVYAARVDVDADGVHDPRITGTKALRRADGTTYPPNSVDPEEVRIDPLSGDLWWSQEGNRAATPVQPSIERSTRAGAHRSTLPLPANYAITPDAGPRGNLALEAITFDAAGTLLTSVVEGPLLEDGEESTVDEGSLARITVQTRFGHVLAQYAYPLEPLFAEPKPDPWGPDTGVSAILADPRHPGRYLAVERSWVPGWNYKVRVYEIDVLGASDIKHVRSLATDGDGVRPVRKRLVADLHDLPLPVIDNVEGLVWGPRLPSGERTLVLVSDDNFAAEEFTRFIALAVR
ncbi:esterase-like activity of phytase family protein [Saccharothrix obliqua]|uniref:esterase-like activity of phytase family protein n=1 Tax=Saccharothrix obliqua TaxID=2861747 RepID=UPI0021510380|nr:esterase-like activity of phytase family protein [Saccharothrix obliqua]